MDPDGCESESIQRIPVTAKRPAPVIIWLPVQSSRRVDPLLKPWVSQIGGGSQTGTPGFDPDDDDDSRGRSRSSNRTRTGKSD